MFNRLTPKTVFHIFSFLSDREVASYACVSKSAHIDVLKSRMRAFSIGRERLKSLCLMNPEMAKFGIDIDSARARYLLLVNDICDIALINEEVARHVLTNVRLRKAGRLDRNFSVRICKHYPQLAEQLFSQEDVKLPDSDEIIDIITEHPDIFERLLPNRKFINIISNSETLVKLGLINEAIALSIYNNSDKFVKPDKHNVTKDRFDKDWYASAVGSEYESVALKILADPKYKNVLHDVNLMILGKRHVEAAKIIISNNEFTSLLNNDELGVLQNKVTNYIIAVTKIH